MTTGTTTTAISDAIGVGFGTAGLGEQCYDVVKMALDAGFRKFDTAEADLWYNQREVGRALKSWFDVGMDDECVNEQCSRTCAAEDLQITTKIPPWSLTSASDIRAHAKSSREQLVGFCEDLVVTDDQGNLIEERPYPLDVYFIHLPRCWDGWHPRCNDPPEPLPLREAWLAMEAIVGIDKSAKRIGLSNVSVGELLDIIQFVKERQDRGDTYPPPRFPDAVQNYADPLRPAKEIREVCRQHGIEFVSYSTLGTQHRVQPNVNPVLTHSAVKELSEKHERSTAEVVLSWAVQRDMSVIPRSTKRNHILELANLVHEEPFLSESDLQLIDGMALN